MADGAHNPRTLLEHVDGEQQLDVREAIGWVTRTAKTLADIHGLGRVHGAVCPDAILIDRDSDNGAGSLAHPDDVEQISAYQSNDRAHGAAATPADDVWALCITLHYALTGTVPYKKGVTDWLAAGREDMPPMAVRGADLSVMQLLLEGLLKPTSPADSLPSAAELVEQLCAFSPKTAELEPLALSAKLAADTPEPADVEGAEGDAYLDVDVVVSDPPPAKAPPGPPPRRRQDAIPPPKRRSGPPPSPQAVLLSLPPAGMSVQPAPPPAQNVVRIAAVAGLVGGVVGLAIGLGIWALMH